MYKIRAYYNITIPVIATLIYIFAFIFKFVCIDSINIDTYVNLAIAIAGFLFTSFSIILAVSDKSLIIYLRKAGNMRRLEQLMALGILSSCISIIAYVFKSLQINALIIIHLIVYGSFLGIICFITSGYKIFRILKLANSYSE